MTIGFPLTTAFSNETGRPAPQWDILEWLNADGGNVGRLRGKVIVIDFFQLWCPGCNEFSGPLMQSWQEKYSSAVASGDLVLVKIHTVFEGHNYQTVRKLKSYIKEKKITIPVGVDRHAEGERIPTTMRRYRTRGTPEMVIIDRDGLIRFQRFGYFEPQLAETLIGQLLGDKRA
ncbi:MAG: TlpA family protein disulfide reductase [Alphaproteobacteria bacterium]|nr:TlpA family protein disulfide reductase [Alphaproteobacteria bacterium]